MKRYGTIRQGEAEREAQTQSQSQKLFAWTWMAAVFAVFLYFGWPESVGILVALLAVGITIWSIWKVIPR